MYDGSAWRRFCGPRGAGEQLLEVGAFDPHSPSDPDRPESALVDPAADHLLIELEQARDLGDGE